MGGTGNTGSMGDPGSIWVVLVDSVHFGTYSGCSSGYSCAEK